MAERALYLGMAVLAHDDELVALSHEPLRRAVALLDEGAGRVEHRGTGRAGSLLDCGRHAVGPQEQGRALPHLVGRGDHRDARALQLAHHDGVVDERAERVHRALGGATRLERKLERALHAEAGAGLVGHDDARGGSIHVFAGSSHG